MPDILKRVIVTGASDGLGLRLVKLFSDQNVELIVTGRRPASKLQLKFPNNVHYIQADQARLDCANLILQEIERLGWENIDHLILNAGTGSAVDAIEEDADNLRNTMNVNLITPVTIVHQLALLLINAGGNNDSSRRSCVTIIGSSAAKGATGFASYAASKAGLSGFSRALSSEWRDDVDVQIIHPGPTQTQMHEKAGLKPGLASRWFIDPDFCATTIMRHIESRKPVANISMLDNAFFQLRRKIGLAPNHEKPLRP